MQTKALNSCGLHHSRKILGWEMKFLPISLKESTKISVTRFLSLNFLPMAEFLSFLPVHGETKYPRGEFIQADRHGVFTVS